MQQRIAMIFGLIKERKNPPDRRVVFSPDALEQLREDYPDAVFKVEPSDIRVFPDEAYRAKGFEVTDDLSDCDVLLGVKEVPVEALLPGKKYFFFSHTIKKQPYNQKLLQAVLEKNITLYDHETIVEATGKRLIGFGRYAGIVGAYNTIRAFGIKFDLFKLPKAESLRDKEELVDRLKKQVLPPLKIVLTGMGKVGMGAREVLNAVKIKEVSVEAFLTKNFSEPVYVQLDVLDYNKRMDGVLREKEDFYRNPALYVSDFERFSKTADIFIAGHFYAEGAPKILTREMLLQPDNHLKVVGDISCDIDGPIACTLKASTIADPFYGYLPKEHTITDMHHPKAITVMAVDNLPCELPRDASEGFGKMFSEHVMPAFFNGDKEGVLCRAKITENGRLTDRFRYLEDYAGGELVS